MVEGDLFREVNEELRRERLKQLWDRFGSWVLTGAAVIVAVVGGYKYWQYWTAQQSAAAGARYVAALSLVEDGQQAEALEAFKAMAADAPAGYRLLAHLQMAGLAVKEDRIDDALAIYDAIVGDRGADQLLRDYATVQSAMLRVDKEDWTKIKNRLNQLIGAESPWRFSAREIVGLAAYRAGKMDEAERLFNDILSEPGVPTGVRQRANVMLALIIGAGASAKAGSKAKAEAAEKTN